MLWHIQYIELTVADQQAQCSTNDSRARCRAEYNHVGCVYCAVPLYTVHTCMHEYVNTVMHAPTLDVYIYI
jgi:hypothetical protein